MAQPAVAREIARETRRFHQAKTLSRLSRSGGGATLTNGRGGKSSDAPRAQTWDVLREWHAKATEWDFNTDASTAGAGAVEAATEATEAAAAEAEEAAGAEAAEAEAVAAEQECECKRRRREELDLMPLLADIAVLEAGRCTLTPPDPQLKGAWYPGGFKPRTYQLKKPVSKRALQNATRTATWRRSAPRWPPRRCCSTTTCSRVTFWCPGGGAEMETTTKRLQTATAVAMAAAAATATAAVATEAAAAEAAAAAAAATTVAGEAAAVSAGSATTSTDDACR
jgi:hypothetical protein